MERLNLSLRWKANVFIRFHLNMCLNLHCTMFFSWRGHKVKQECLLFLTTCEQIVKFTMIQTNWYERHLVSNSAIVQMWKNLNLLQNLSCVWCGIFLAFSTFITCGMLFCHKIWLFWFMPFCYEIYFVANSCAFEWRKIEPKIVSVEKKMTNMRSV